MPRPAKGPRLFLREREGRSAIWVILDSGAVEISTSCGAADRRGAEKALASYLAQKHSSAVGTHNPGILPIVDVLNFYAGTKDPGETTSKVEIEKYDKLLNYIKNLITFFGDDQVSDIRAARCRDYVRWRGHVAPRPPEWPEYLPRAVIDQTARRELVVLSAAIGLYHAEFTLDMVPIVTLPEMPQTNRRAIEHQQAAALLAGALGFYRNDDGKLRRRPRSTRTQRKRTARFIIIGIYSGTRHSAITNASWLPRLDGPWVDVDRGIYYRRGGAEKETDKRRPPARIPPRLLVHLRRWRDADLAKGNQWVLPAQNDEAGRKKSGGKVRRGWAGAVTDGRTLCPSLPENVTPHWLRHTAGTWLAQGGISSRDGGDYLGMSEEVFERVYYHNSPDYQDGIGDAFGAAKAKAREIAKRKKK
jgi:integrase